MKKQAWKTVGLMMAFVGAASFANAQSSGGGGNREEMIKKYDKDGDGKLSEAERATLRADMQANSGGRGQGQSGEQGKGRDGEQGKSRGATLTSDELIAKYDTDKNGELSKAELEVYITAQKERSQSRGSRGGRGGPEGGDSAQGQGRQGQGGQRVSREEMMTKYDKDGDGQLSDEERATMRADMQKQR